MIRHRYDDVKAEVFDGLRETTEGLDEAKRRRMKTKERALVRQGDFILELPDVLSSQQLQGNNSFFRSGIIDAWLAE